MGLLKEGQWVKTPRDGTQGKFIRKDAAFRSWITRDGSSGFKGEAGRYRLYVSLACPWAHRALILRSLKGLQEAIPITVVNYRMLDNGWEFRDEDPDPLGSSYIYQVYLRANPEYEGRASVPVLWDNETNTIVSNESSEIIQMFNSEFECAQNEYNFYPEELKEKIDEINQFVYHRINNGVYKCGFARSQDAYEEAITELYEGLDRVEDILSQQRYLVGNVLTLADIRLFTTLIRFDLVYVGLFKCNIKRIADYPNLLNYLRDIYQYPGISETVDFHDIKNHYYFSLRTINPTQVVPRGPLYDYNVPHDRDRFN